MGEDGGLCDEDLQIHNLTPYALRYFFEKRLAGQPKVRDYLLGRRTDVNRD